MKIAIFTGAGLFVLLLVFHILVWRLIKPKGEIIPLVGSFVLCPLLLMLMQYLFFPLQLGNEMWLGWLLYFVLAGCYIQTYPAITTEIPSLKIVLLLHSCGSLSEREIVAAFTQHEMFQSRVELLKQDYLIDMDGTTPKLSYTGRLLAKVFLAYRAFLGAEIGKG